MDWDRETRKPYYVNDELRKTQWDRPVKTSQTTSLAGTGSAYSDNLMVPFSGSSIIPPGGTLSPPIEEEMEDLFIGRSSSAATERYEIQPIFKSTLDQIPRLKTADCLHVASHIADQAHLSIEVRRADAICYRFMQAHRNKNDYQVQAALEASMSLSSALLGIIQGGTFLKALISSGFGTASISHILLGNFYQAVINECGATLSKLLGEKFVKDLYKLNFDEKGLDTAIQMLQQESTGFGTWFLQGKLAEIKKRKSSEKPLIFKVVKHLKSKTISDELPPEALAEQELLDQIEDLPKRAGQILTIAAMLGERLDVLLVASLLMTSPDSVEDCIWDLEKAGYLKNGSITSQFLASAVMKNVPADKKKERRAEGGQL